MKIRIRISSKWLLILIAAYYALSFAQGDARTYFFEGNQAYRQGNYQTALQWYQKILDSGYESGAVYYNMGNACYKSNQIGLAILYYEKALQLRPNDPEIKFNLELANQKRLDRIDLPPRFFLFEWWEGIRNSFSLSQLAGLTAGLYLLTVALVIGILFLRQDRIRKWLISAVYVVGIVTAFWSYIFISNIIESNRNKQGIILAPSVTVQSAPDENGTDIFVIHEGLKVKLEEQRGNWVKILLPDGKSGWMEKRLIGIL